ncbi:MAG: bifunctional adenosylcobinamide kinase/adenosylcobinamide-phosphate guanylyltransferase [Thermodesulfobacteriota bacterium]|nr:bifunctional adenosylcobinamide kinase/adenosylcobinamide-phosphate guanylyltransferase [Thermodesulfobacteriota bacterium]
MKETIFVIGGCRSGKSRHALELAEQAGGSNKIFIATCVPRDDEMKQRVELHQRHRGTGWTTIEVPVHLGESIIENNRKADVIIVDCLTLWISNLLMETDDEEEIAGHIHGLIKSLERAQCTVVLVSNEVGTGIVPENSLSRLFRDIAGFANQDVAACSDRVIWMVAGIPVTIKGIK